MAKDKKNKKLSSLFLGVVSHPWLKIISLGLAILLWFYVSGAIGRNY